MQKKNNVYNWRILYAFIIKFGDAHDEFLAVRWLCLGAQPHGMHRLKSTSAEMRSLLEHF